MIRQDMLRRSFLVVSFVLCMAINSKFIEFEVPKVT